MAMQFVAAQMMNVVWNGPSSSQVMKPPVSMLISAWFVMFYHLAIYPEPCCLFCDSRCLCLDKIKLKKILLTALAFYTVVERLQRQMFANLLKD